MFNLATYRNSLARSTKSTTLEVFFLCLLVGARFQVLFHSPPGVLFTFPSRYYSLSVTRQYLALGGGPPIFPQNFTCSVVLFLKCLYSDFDYKTVTFFGSSFHKICLSVQSYFNGLFSVRSPLLGESSFLSFLVPTQMFQFRTFASIRYVFTYGYQSVSSRFPHSDSPELLDICSYSRFSLLVTSFFASWCQGIRLTPLVS